jgi:hypothetical protein
MTTDQKLAKLADHISQNSQSIHLLYTHLSELEGLDPKKAKEFKQTAFEVLSLSNKFQEELS